MYYKKIIIAVTALIFFIVSGFMIYNVNTDYPNAEEKAFKVGEVTRYKGLKLTVGELEIYTEKELIEKYEDTNIAEQIIKGNLDAAESTYIIANVTLENDTDETITFGKLDSLGYWIIEVGMTSNGTLNFQYVINPNWDSLKSYSVGEVQNVKLLYCLTKNKISYDQIKQSDVKIIFSYYPTKNYLLYEGEK